MTLRVASAREFLLNARYAFRPRKPLLLVRLAAALARARLQRRPRLRYVDFCIGLACNLKCRHCFATAFAREPGDAPRGRRLTMADYARVAREAMALGAVNFSFQGGEPLLYGKLPRIVAACRPERNLVSVKTNGTLLDAPHLDALQRMGVDILTVSVDSADPVEHDRFRGVDGAFERTMAGVERALSRGFRVALATVVTRPALRGPGLAAMIGIAERLRCLLYLILPVPAGRWRDDREMMLTDDDLALVEELTRRSPLVRTDFSANLGGYGCGAVKEILYVTEFGDVLACPFMHISLGSVHDAPLAAIRDRALEQPYFARYNDRCLVSTDAAFIENHLSRTFAARTLPISYDEGFGG